MRMVVQLWYTWLWMLAVKVLFSSKKPHHSTYVRRHLLCPHFAPRFVSAFFFRARGGAAARHDGGLRMGGAVYAVSARGPDTVTSHPERYSYQLRTVVDGGDPRAFAADGAAVCQEVQYLNMCQPL